MSTSLLMERRRLLGATAAWTGVALALVEAVERVVPGYVSRDAAWKTPTSGRVDYMRLKRGQELMP